MAHYVIEIATGDAAIRGKAIYEFDTEKTAVADWHRRLGIAMNSALFETDLVMVIDDSGYPIKCEKYVAPPVYYTVTFDANGHGTAPASQSVKKNAVVANPGTLYCEGYTFTGWYTEAECTNLYDFSTPVTFGITLYAGWEVAPELKPEGIEEPEVTE